MTSTKPPRRVPYATPSRLSERVRTARTEGGNGRSPVGEQLRERPRGEGVSIFTGSSATRRSGSSTWKRSRAGTSRDLPGDVYTRGFLRNYATYLGLDADDIVEEWRQRGRRSRSRSADARRPAADARSGEGVVFQRSHVHHPGGRAHRGCGRVLLRLPGHAVPAVPDAGGLRSVRTADAPASPRERTSYVLKGTATPGTTVLISWDGQDPTTVVA